MLKIGITGGIGSGKSLLIDYFADMEKALILRADEIGRKLQEPFEAAYWPIIDEFGNKCVNADGTLDRAWIAKIVFEDPDKLKKLNSIVHPMVESVIRAHCHEALLAGTKLVLVESAILIEVGYKAFCDEVWFVKAPVEDRIRRVMDERGLNREEVERVIANQMTDLEYEQVCDRTIDNSGSVESLRTQIEAELFRLGLEELIRN